MGIGRVWAGHAHTTFYPKVLLSNPTQFIAFAIHMGTVGKVMAKSMAEEEEEHCVVVYHYLECDFSSTDVQIKSADRSPRLTQ